jgi:hypothetical protein
MWGHAIPGPGGSASGRHSALAASSIARGSPERHRPIQ